MSCGLDEVFDERGDQRPGCAGSDAGGEQVEGPVAGEELGGVEVFARFRRDGVENTRISQAGEGQRDAHPDGVACAGVGLQSVQDLASG